MAILFINKVSTNRDAFEAKVKDIAFKLGIDPNWLMFLMDFESGISSTIENSFSCVGLIQFCPDKSSLTYKTIGGKRYELSEIKSMSNVNQLDLVYGYLKPYKGDMQTYYDLYFAILWPDALGKDDSYVIRTGTNPVFDLNKNGTITVAEVKQFLDNRVNDLVKQPYLDSFKKKVLFCESIREKSYTEQLSFHS